jgi:hypothetical protein
VQVVAEVQDALQARCWLPEARYWTPGDQGDSELKDDERAVLMACPKRDWTWTDAW